MICYPFKEQGSRLPVKLSRPVTVLEAFSLVRVDFMGPFKPPSSAGNHHVIVGADYFSWSVFTLLAESPRAERSRNRP